MMLDLLIGSSLNLRPFLALPATLAGPTADGPTVEADKTIDKRKG